MSYTDFDFPHTSLYTSDLREVIANVRRLEDIVKTFVNTEQVKFADPIIWNITSQYAKTTVVLDTEGNAYLSKQAVPSGIQLNNEEYWQEIFNFTDYTRTANQNLTVNEERNTTRATNDYAIDDWLIWNDVLYKVTSPIAVDDALVVGTNLVHFTVEDFIKAFITWATNTIQQYKNDIDASELAYRQQLAQDIASTTASLQAQLDAAIAGATVDSEVINARIGADGITYNTLGNAIRSQYHELSSGIPDIDNMDIDVTELNPISVVTNNFVKADGTYQSDSGFRVLVFDVSGLKRIKIRSYNVSAAVLYVALDANDNVVSSYSSGLSGVHFLRDNIILPDTVTKIKINDCNTNAFNIFGLSKVWQIDKVYSKLQSVGGANDNVIAFPHFTAELDNTFIKHVGANAGTQLTPSSTTAAHFFELYTLNELKQLKLSTMSEGTIYEYNVTPGKTYLVKTYANAWAFKSWYATDERYVVQSMCEDTPINKWLYRPFIVSIPKGASKLVVNWADIRSMGDIYKCEVYEIESYFSAGTNHNIGVIGDSISQKVSSTATPPNYADKFWWEILGEKLNCAIDCVAQRGSGFKHAAVRFEQQIATLQTNNELVIVFGSGNDMSFYDPINEYGEMSDVFTTFEDSSVAACMMHFFRTWRSTYPLKKLIVFSPTLWNGYDADLNPTNPKMIKYAALLKNVCEHFAVPFVDMTTGSGFIPSVEDFRTEYTVDGTHLNTAGQNFIAPFFIDAVKRIIL